MVFSTFTVVPLPLIPKVFVLPPVTLIPTPELEAFSIVKFDWSVTLVINPTVEFIPIPIPVLLIFISSFPESSTVICWPVFVDKFIPYDVPVPFDIFISNDELFPCTVRLIGFSLIAIPVAFPEPLLSIFISPPFKALTTLLFAESDNTIFVEFTPFEVKLISPEFFATISVPDLSEVNVFPEVFISILLPESSEVTFNIELPFATTPVPIPAFFMIISPPVDEWILVTSVVW